MLVSVLATCHYDDIVDPNATTLPMHSTPGIDSPVIGIHTAGTEYISPVFDIPPPKTASGWDHTHTHTHTTRHFTIFRYKLFLSVVLSLIPSA